MPGMGWSSDHEHHDHDEDIAEDSAEANDEQGEGHANTFALKTTTHDSGKIDEADV